MQIMMSETIEEEKMKSYITPQEQLLNTWAEISCGQINSYNSILVLILLVIIIILLITIILILSLS